MSLLDDLKSENNNIDRPTNPKEVFATLNPEPHYDYLRGVQTDFLEKWYKRKDQKDIIGILGTGTGKTLVGLLALQSHLNSGEGPCAYICPTNQLVNQVCQEANNFGINVVKFSENSLNIPIEFLNSESILVMNFDKLFNGKTIFGFDVANYIEIGSLVIDDAHTAIQKVQSTSTLTIKKDNKMYEEIVSIFKDSLENQQFAKFNSIINNDSSNGVMKVPYWEVDAQKTSLLNILSSSNLDSNMQFSYPFILSSKNLIEVYIGSRQIDIKPYHFPVDLIPSFDKAKHRLFLSATLSNVGSFISELGIQTNALDNPIKISSLIDTGEKWILALERINHKYNDENMLNIITSLSKKRNVLVLVPSNQAAEKWVCMGANLYDTKNISSLKKSLKNDSPQMVVLANKYDGIDLPDDLCHIVVIDGKPNQITLTDNSNAQRLPHSLSSKTSIIREIEQGMGRAVRSNSDYSLIFLLGNKLQDFISLNNNMFTAETQAQWSFFKQISNKIKKYSPEEVNKEVIKLLSGALNQSKQWKDVYKNYVQEKYKSILNEQLNPDYSFELAERKAWMFALEKDYNSAANIIKNYAENKNNVSNDIFNNGIYYELQAKYTYKFDKKRAFDLQKKAHSLNNFLFKSPNTSYSKRTKRRGNEGYNFYKYIKKMNFDNSSDLATNIRSINDDLIYSNNVDEYSFRRSIQRLGLLLGFDSSQPESESGIKEGGPDNLWLNEERTIVIENKNQVTSDTVSKNDVEQITNSSTWFGKKYINEHFEPVLFHRSSKASKDAHTKLKVRVVSKEKIQLLKDSINKFADSINQKPIDYWDSDKLQNAFNDNCLLRKTFLDLYTVPLQQYLSN